MIRKNEGRIKGLFSSLLINLRKSLVSHNVDVKDLRQFLVTYFKCDDCIPKSHDIDEIFAAVTINGLWSYQHYCPLESLIEYFLSDDPKVHSFMNDYRDNLSGFFFMTKIINYIEYKKLEASDSEEDSEPLKSYIAQHYRQIKVVLKLDRKVSDLSLRYVEKLWRSFASEFDLPSLTAVVKKITAGSLAILWSIPPWEAEKIKPTSKFCRQHNIIMIAIDDDVIYDERQMVSVVLLLAAARLSSSSSFMLLNLGGV